MAEIVCARCSHPNSVAANFCSSCGFDLSRHLAEVTDAHTIDLDSGDDGPPTTEVDAIAPAGGVAEFVVKRGAKAGSRFMIDESLVTLGRHPESRIFLDDITVSRRHAEVCFVDGSYVVTDVGSLNGTYLNRERVEEGRLTSGDELQVGKFKLLFLLEGPS